MKHKIKYILAILLIILLNGYSYSNDNKPRYSGQTIIEILQLPEEQIDLGMACLILAKEFYPDMDVNFYLNLIDGYAFNILKMTKGVNEYNVRIGSINTCLYKRGPWNDKKFFEYDLDDLEAMEMKNKFLHCYLDSKKGSCITMPMFYIVLAQRLNWPVYAVCATRHFFCRYYKNDSDYVNIEPTAGGGLISDSSYVTDLGMGERSLKNGVYMRTLSNKEYIGRLMTINAGIYFEQGNLEKAQQYLSIATHLDSTCSDAYWNLAVCYFQNAKALNEKMEMEKQTIQFVMNQKNPQKIDPNLLPTSNRDRILKQIQESEMPVNSSMQSYNYQVEISDIERQYISQINENIEMGQWCKNHAEKLGITHEFPHSFFIKQKESIENFLKKGEY